MTKETRQIYVGRGVASGDDAFATGKDAASQAWSGLDKNPASAVLVFASVQYQLQALLAGIHTVASGDSTAWSHRCRGNL